MSEDVAVSIAGWRRMCLGFVLCVLDVGPFQRKKCDEHIISFVFFQKYGVIITEVVCIGWAGWCAWRMGGFVGGCAVCAALVPIPVGLARACGLQHALSHRDL